MWANRVPIAAVVGALFFAMTFYVLWAIKDLPNPSQDVLAAGDVVVLDRNGKLIEDWNRAGHYHVNVALKDMGPHAAKAVLAAEDRNFYNHGAVDPLAMGRALWVDVTHRGLKQGGSTITQQLVKIQLLTPQKSVARKLQEVVLAVTLEERYSKDQILSMYMNRVYFGHGAYGIQAASRTYFTKDSKDLTVAQAAFLAGIIQAPTAYDPAAHYDLAHQRQLYVLQGMVETKSISQADADKAAGEDVKSQLHIQQTARQSKAPHFVDYVMSVIEGLFGPSEIQQGGIVVRTTLDLDVQQNAQQAVVSGVDELSWAHVNNSALLAADPRTGEILAWVGSANYGNDSIAGQFDVVQAKRQPGSSFKPYVYEAALRDHKITWATVLHDSPTNFNGYQPRDFDNRGMGDIPARTALLQSRNIPAVQVGQMEGIQNVIDLAHQMGVKSKLQPVLSTAIGSSEVSLLEHVQGYATFANQGQRADLSVIREVDDASGRAVYKHENPSSTTVLTPAEAYLMTDVLKDYPTTWGFGWNRQMAAKTGTSDDGHGQIPDSWILAYNPQVVVGVWVGNTAPDGGGGRITAYGENVGRSVMKRFINGLPANMGGWYARPGGVQNCTGQQTPFLPGTCPTPSPSPSPSPSPFELTTPSILPSILPSPLASPSPRPSASPSPPKASPGP
jgi:membrane peptidoglycan carboxypeptidase